MALRLDAFTAPIPFRTRFAHAAASRQVAENVIVRVRDASGLEGWGEGCPRPYVTDETVASALAFLSAERREIERIEDLPALRDWLDRPGPRRNPAGACAAELALLDLIGQQRGASLESLLGVATSDAPPPRVSAVYGLGSPWSFHLRRWRYGLAGMADAKLKLSGDAAQDIWRAAILAKRGRVRLDANNLWDNAASAIAALRSLAHHAWAVEEPVGSRDWSALREIATATPMSIVLDESFTRLDDLAAVSGDDRFVLNLRISKLGGLMRTLEAIDGARAVGHRLIIGSQVGETSLLARAALVVATAAGADLVAIEAGYGRRLLRWDAAQPSLTFDAHGRLSPAPAGPGAGLRPTARLQAMAPS